MPASQEEEQGYRLWEPSHKYRISIADTPYLAGNPEGSQSHLPEALIERQWEDVDAWSSNTNSSFQMPVRIYSRHNLNVAQCLAVWLPPLIGSRVVSSAKCLIKSAVEADFATNENITLRGPNHYVPTLST